MEIDSQSCIGCRICIPYCPVKAINMQNDIGEIDLEKCVECGVCIRMANCPTGAIKPTAISWPRSVRKFFSDPTSEHVETRIPGRGTEEMKTNDVTARFGYEEAGFSIDVGRPGIGTALLEVEKISVALAKLGVMFEPLNPLTNLMEDPRTGRLRSGIKNERVLSAIIEFKVQINKVKEVLKTLGKVESEVDTVFSVGVACRVAADGRIPVASIIEELELRMYPNGKTNVGLGKR